MFKSGCLQDGSKKPNKKESNFQVYIILSAGVCAGAMLHLDNVIFPKNSRHNLI